MKGEGKASWLGRGKEKGLPVGIQNGASGFPKPHRWRTGESICSPDLQLTVA